MANNTENYTSFKKALKRFTPRQISLIEQELSAEPDADAEEQQQTPTFGMFSSNGGYTSEVFTVRRMTYNQYHSLAGSAITQAASNTDDVKDVDFTD